MVPLPVLTAVSRISATGGNSAVKQVLAGVCALVFANGTLTQQDGADFTNRLVNQLYVYQEMIDHPEAATLLPTTVRNNGAGWYTQSASTGEYENLGQFPNGKDKGYRFRWSLLLATPYLVSCLT